jgi:hypothetical protein
MDTPDGAPDRQDDGNDGARADHGDAAGDTRMDGAADALDHAVARQVQGQGRKLAGAVALVFSVLMHLAIGMFVFSSGLIAPGWAVVGLISVWTAGAWGIWRFRRVPELVLVIPMAMAVVWWATITLGERFLGWTA